jgi:3-oxoacyl-[acyl-carrier-protein] synthase I
MNTPYSLQPAHVIGRGLACTADNPAERLRQWSDGTLPQWSSVAVPGYPSVERPFGFLHGKEDPVDALDRVLDESLREAALGSTERRNAGIVLGTSSLNIGHDEADCAQRIDSGVEPMLLEDARWGHMLDETCARHGLRGPQYTLNTACSSSANALLYAQRMLSTGVVPAVIVIGFDAYTGISFSGFHGMLLLSQAAYRPFDARREGIVLAEGAAAAVLVRADERAEARIDGGHSAIDVTGVTNASEDSLASVMDSALKPFSPESIRAIKAHGTGTPGNDSAESAAIQAVFGGHVPPLFSIKGGLGHTLGACGLVELLALMDCRKAGFLPASIGYEQADDSLPLQAMDKAMDFDGGRLLLNYFGFGGNNSSLVVSL